MAQALLINVKDLVKFTSLDGSTDADKVVQYIKIAQDMNVQSSLGSNLYESIQAKIIAGTLTGNYLALVTDFVKPMLVHWTMVHYLPFAPVTLANKGAFIHGSENATAVSKSQIDYLIGKETDTATFYQSRLTDYLCANPTMFPEYITNTSEDIKPSTKNFVGGWYF